MDNQESDEKPVQVASELNDWLGVGTEAYFIDSIRLSHVREFLGGCKAVDSTMFVDGVQGLYDLGWSDDRVMELLTKELGLHA